jgi:hypothetical protein
MQDMTGYLTGSFETQTNSTVVTQVLLGFSTFTVQEDGWLFLESLLILQCTKGHMQQNRQG